MQRLVQRLQRLGGAWWRWQRQEASRRGGGSPSDGSGPPGEKAVRVQQHGHNAWGDSYLVLAGIELYGTLTQGRV